MGMPLPPPIPPTPLSAREVHIRSSVAVIGAIAAWSFVLLLLYANFDASLFERGSGVFERIAFICFASATLLWIVMWLEFARERPARFRLLWVVLLMSGPVIGPLLFYYLVYRKRYKAVASPNNALDRERGR
jgi:hypothetical protein